MDSQRKTGSLKSGQIIVFIFFLLLFFVVSFYFFRYPLASQIYFLFFLAFSVWTVVLLDFSSANFFMFLSFLLGIGGLLFQWTGYSFEQLWKGKLGLGGELLVLWFIRRGVRKSRSAEEKTGIEQEKKLKELRKNSEELTREIESGTFQFNSLEAKINRFQLLSLAARELGSLLKVGEIQNKLKSLLATCFPETAGRVSVEPFELSRDPFSKWIGERFAPLLVTDLGADLRFPETVSSLRIGSLLAAPLIAGDKIVGIARIEGKEPGLYDNDDLRLLDMFTTVGSLALENAHLFSKVQELSVTDTLTGLYTHRFFQERLNEEILRAGRYQLDLGLLLVDIDHFKKYNDTYGHQVGDEILKMVANFIKQKIRTSDLLARYGGEEFAVLLLQSGYPTSHLVAERMCQAIAASPFFISGETIKVTVSIGVSAFPEEATIASQFIRVADQRLYQAKAAGRNRVGGKEQ